MIQNDNPQTYVVTIDISDLQADLPLFGACTGDIRPLEEESLVSLVDPNTLAPSEEEKIITTEQVFLDQDVVYVQEEQVQVQEVPQNEVIIETVQEETCSQDQVVEIELSQMEEESWVEEDDDTDGMNLVSDDLASLLSEDMDEQLKEAAEVAIHQNSLGPILKEELKTIIQHRRVKGGKEELKLGETRKRAAPVPVEDESEETVERKRRRRERNKVAAQKCRTRKKERTEELEDETAELVAHQKKIKEEVEKLKQEKEMLVAMLRFHDASPAARCGRALSQSDD